MRWRAGLVAALLAASPVAAFDRAAWLADFDAMKAAITATSPNLEWQAARGLDLAAVEARARGRLARANDDGAARFAFDRFIRNFADGHMELSWPSAPGPAAASAAARPVPICAALGFRDDKDTDAIATALPGFVPLPGATGDARAGTIAVGKRHVGVLRIAQFSPGMATCARVLIEQKRAPDAPCDDACADAVSVRANQLFVGDIARQVRALSRLRPTALLVDVASNGGGNDASMVIARMLTAKPLAAPEVAMVRTAARARRLGEDRADLAKAVATASPGDAAILRSLLRNLEAAQREAATPCDLAPLWRGERAGCSNLIRQRFYAGGLTAQPLPEALTTAPWAEQVDATARYHTPIGLWRGPLLVLIDGNAASSTELFAAMLQDAGAATVVGAPSVGAGCGWTMGEAAVVLPNSGGRLLIPDCARFRRDGTNEIDGIQPDFLIGFRQFDSQKQRVARLAARLGQLPLGR